MNRLNNDLMSNKCVCRTAPATLGLLKNITCHVSYIICHKSHVGCHLSLTPTATAMDPPPANYRTTMHKRMVCKDPKKVWATI